LDAAPGPRVPAASVLPPHMPSPAHSAGNASSRRLSLPGLPSRSEPTCTGSSRLGIDVVRIAELSTAYSFTVGGRPAIAVPATGNWFRENWDIAHELGHLIMGHHDDGLAQGDADRHEAAANAFAAELLLPATDLSVVDWDATGDDGLAALVWSWGVSTDALCRRLCTLLGYAPSCAARWAARRSTHPRSRRSTPTTWRPRSACDRRERADVPDNTVLINFALINRMDRLCLV